uniref:Uncharacterized protein n=1 Tax=Pithovirus LCPAC101 TaxID=2506586 RepID=A0A481Z3S6_9VIRU|nr:MAG: hypothetical protein LCPAC101_03060 [Pithovirus LCPAC101]
MEHAQMTVIASQDQIAKIAFAYQMEMAEIPLVVQTVQVVQVVQVTHVTQVVLALALALALAQALAQADHLYITILVLIIKKDMGMMAVAADMIHL